MKKIKMFPFTKCIVNRKVLKDGSIVENKSSKKMLPTIDDLPDRKMKMLPGQCVHMEWVRRVSFGREYLVHLAWIVGCKMPLKWDDRDGKWVDDIQYR